MATEMRTVNIPDHAAIKLPKSLTTQEVRDTLAQQGYPSVLSANVSEDAQGNLTFQRPSGGTKGF